MVIIVFVMVYFKNSVEFVHYFALIVVGLDLYSLEGFVIIALLTLPTFIKADIIKLIRCLNFYHL